MMLTRQFIALEDGTLDQLTADNAPDGVTAEDHHAGMEASLEQLAVYLGG